MRRILLLGALAFVFPIFASAAVIQASKQDVAGVKTEMDSRLKDADSAKIKDVRLVADGADSWIMCGLVSAKNSYGAYTGYEDFFGMKMKDKAGKFVYAVLGIGDSAGSMCRKNGL
jgi:hypothetical protein